MSQSRSSLRGRTAAAVLLVLVASGLQLIRASRAAQAPAPSAPPGSKPPAEGRFVANLATRYHLVERYSTTEDRLRPELIAQYRVALRETIKTVTDNVRGAPTRSEGGEQTIYSERPAEVSDRAAVTAVVRRYETFRLTTGKTPAKASSVHPLEGMTIWYEPEAREVDRRVLCLTAGRPILDSEYAVISRQVFLPALAANVLPPMPRQIGESWDLSPLAVKSLVGEPPFQGGVVAAKLAEIRNDAKPGRLVAVITLTGKVVVPTGEAAVNAQLLFSFATPAAPAPGAEKAEGNDEGTVEAWGAITELRLAVAKTAVLTVEKTRLRRVQTNELILGRQLATTAPPLPLPSAPPTPTEANSWLTYVDPRGRFHFQHSQDFRPIPPQTEDDVVQLYAPKPMGADEVSFEIIAKTGDPQTDAQNRDPEFHRKNLKAQWLKDQISVTQGFYGWLPKADWEPLNLEVYRIEAAVTPVERGIQGTSRRIFADYYLVLPSRNEALFVESRTFGENPVRFSKTVEAMLKTFRFGTPEDARKK
jgi:hypothetical protein